MNCQRGKQKELRTLPQADRTQVTAEEKETNYTALVGKHVTLRVRQLQLENKWMSMVDNEGLQGDVIRT